MLVQSDHPLLVLLHNLRSALSKFQDDAHASALNLQHHALSTHRTLERAHALESENRSLNDELATLRANPLPSFSDSQQSIHQLTLSLRSLNEKLTTTESLLSQRTAHLSGALDDLRKSQSMTDTAYELCSRIRGREEALNSRVNQLQLKLQLAEERARMSERAVEEYADLVRTLEGRQPQNNTHAVVSSPTHDQTIERVLHEFAEERETLQIQLSSALHDLALVSSQNTALIKSSQDTLAELVDLRMKFQVLERDDTTAAKMVSRYMKFSQTQTNALQTTLFTLTERHSSTLTSLTSHIHTLSQTIHHLQTHNSRLLSAVDELGSELLKEGFGRRQEVRLRIRLVAREERILEGLRRWMRRAEERFTRSNDDNNTPGSRGEVLSEMIQDAKILIDTLDNPVPIFSGGDEELPITTPVSGSLARLVTVQNAIDDLIEDLQREHARRVTSEGRIIRQEIEGPLPIEPTSTTESQAKGILLPPSRGTMTSDESVDDVMMTQDLPPATVTPTFPDVEKSSSPPITVSQENGESGPRPPRSQPQHVLSVSPLPPESPPTTRIASPAGHTQTLIPDTQQPVSESVDDIAVEPPRKVGLEDTAELQPEPEGHDAYAYPDTDVIGVQEVGMNEPMAGEVQGKHESEQDEVGQAQTTAATNQEEDKHCRVGSEPPSGTEPDHERQPFNEEQTLILAQPQPTKPTVPYLSLSPPPPSLPLVSSLASTRHPTTFPPPLTQADPHPLLQELTKDRSRYGNIQRAFHACHIALQSIQASLPSTSTTGYPHYQRYPIPSLSPSATLDESTYSSGGIPIDMLSAIVQRLDDYTEDARVELEIRVSDEEVLRRGYEALLSLPGALHPSTPSSPTTYRPGDETSESGAGPIAEVEAQIRAFVDGTDPIISRAMKSFERKLGDIEHDVAVIKKAIHAPQSIISSPDASTSSSHELPDQPPPSNNSSNSNNASSTSTGGGWASWLRTPSRPTTPTPSVPAPTFGNIMTNRNRTPGISRRVSAFGLASDISLSSSSQSSSSHSASSSSASDIVKTLGLKVPMPDFAFALTSNATTKSTNLIEDDPLGDGSAGLGLGAFGQYPGMPRSRTISTMYMLGMGIGGVAGGRSPHLSSLPLRDRVVSNAPTLDVVKSEDDCGHNGRDDEDVD